MVWPFRREARTHTLLWRGQDSSLFMTLVGALRQSGIPFERTRARGYESLPPTLYASALFPSPVFKICVRPQDLAQAREIIRVVVEGAPPA